MNKQAAKFEAFGLTDCGYQSDNNEDSFFVSPDHIILAVADGVGGEPHGEVASALAVASVAKLWENEHPHDFPESEDSDWIERAFEFANETIYRHGERHQETFGMASTMVAALIRDQSAVIGTVGDSRAYLITDGRARSITRDHTTADLPQKRASASRTPKKHGLTRSLGRDYSVRCDIYPVNLPPGSWLLLCTDGLHETVDSTEMAQLAAAAESPEDYCQSLIEAALREGGPDNITVIAFRQN